MLNTMMEKENTSCANISVLFLRSCSQPFEHCSIQHDGTSGYTFYNKTDCQNQYIEKNYLPTNYNRTYLLVQCLVTSLIISLFGIRDKCF